MYRFFHVFFFVIIHSPIGFYVSNAQDYASIYRSKDNGVSWTRSDDGFPSIGTVNDFTVYTCGKRIQRSRKTGYLNEPSGVVARCNAWFGVT